MNAVTLPHAAVIVRRTIAAPAEMLFDAFLEPMALAEWMRPGSIRSTIARVDARVGGRYEITMQGDDGPIPHSGEYRLIDRPKKLIFTWISPHAGTSETLVTIDFRAVTSGTEVVVTHELLPETARPAHSRGWTSGLEHLDAACAQGRL